MAIRRRLSSTSLILDVPQQSVIPSNVDVYASRLASFTLPSHNLLPGCGVSTHTAFYDFLFLIGNFNIRSRKNA